MRQVRDDDKERLERALRVLYSYPDPDRGVIGDLIAEVLAHMDELSQEVPYMEPRIAGTGG